MSNIIVVHNARSGGSDQLRQIQEAFAAHHTSPDYISIKSVQKLRHMLKKRGGDTTVVAAGGDGTVNAVVTALHGARYKLGIIPVGTLNHFAKDLGTPLEVNDAVAVIVRGTFNRVDIGTVNGRAFVNNSSIGVYPHSLKVREAYAQHIGKWPAALLGFTRAVVRPRRYRIELLLEGKRLQLRTPFVFVANNAYQRGLNPSQRATLQSGQLAVYIIRAQSIPGIIRALIHGLLSRTYRTRDFTVYHVGECTIRTTHHRQLRVAYDGEVAMLSTPLHYRSESKSLRVIVP